MAQSAIAGKVPGFVIERTAKRLKRAFQQTLASINAGITADQWVVLHLLSEHDGLSQHEIGLRTVKDPPTITKILDLLTKKEMISRTVDPSDRRKFLISLTATGSNTVRRLMPRVQDFRQRHFHGLSDGEMRMLLKILDRINSNILESTLKEA